MTEEEARALARIYRKSAAGVKEMERRAILRDMHRRSLLLLFNGARRLSEAADALALTPSDAVRYANELADLGLAEVVSPNTRGAAGSSGALIDVAADVVSPEIERIFARYIGPLAGVLVRKYILEASDRADLVARLAAHLNDDSQREAFVQAVERLR
jgi:hypothetical protein